jgi:hypothetical protein
MICFTPPIYEQVLPGVRMAVFTVSDKPGSQYVYQNRDTDWLRNLMDEAKGESSLIGAPDVTNFQGAPGTGHLKSPEALARWWIGKQDLYPFSSTGEGALLRILKDQRWGYPRTGTYRMPGDLFVYVMFLGSGSRPCPLLSHWYHSLPRKTRRRRKWEARNQGRTEWKYRGRQYRGWRKVNPLFPYGTDLHLNLFSSPSEETLRFRELLST